MKTLAWLRGVSACLAVLSLTACEEVDGPLGPDYGEDTGGIGGNPPPGTPGTPGTPGNPDDDDDDPVEPGPVEPSDPEPWEPEEPTPQPPPPGGCVSPDFSGAPLKALINECRTCHNTTFGVAKTSRYQLDVKTNAPTDPQKVRAAYKALGRDLLHVPALEMNRTHTGGNALNTTAKYNAWKTVVDTLGQPNACP